MNKELNYKDTNNRMLGLTAPSNLEKAGLSSDKFMSFNDFKTTNDVDAATRLFEGAFERAGKPNMPNRLKYANQYLNTYGGGSGKGPLVNYGGYGLSTMNQSYNNMGTAKVLSNKMNSTNDAKDLINNIINILNIIATNTGDASSKLNLLNKLGGTNVVVNGGNGNKSVSSTGYTPNTTSRQTLSPTNAEKIARGY